MKILISMLTILTLAGSLTACSAKTISGETAPAAESSAESSTESSGSDAAADHSDAALGTWVMRDEDTSSEQVYVSKTEAYSVESFDLTATFSFDENRNFLFKGIPAAKTDYTFKDGVFVFIAKDQIALKMEKTDGSDDVFGEYRILDCEFRKKLQETPAPFVTAAGQLLIQISHKSQRGDHVQRGSDQPANIGKSDPPVRDREPAGRDHKGYRRAVLRLEPHAVIADDGQNQTGNDP